MAQTLGQLLVHARVINTQQLEEAIQAQVIFGGRLGTNLIELGHVDIGTLSRFLAKQFSVPTIDHTRIKPCPKDVLKLFTKKLAVKFEAVPLALDGTRLDVLMSNPSDFAAIDEIGFVTGKRVKAYVAPEVIIVTLLEKYYGVPRDLRYIQMSIRDTQAMRRRHSTPSLTSDEKLIQVAASKPKEREKIKGLEIGRSEELSTEADFREMMDAYHSPAPSAAAQQVPVPRPPPIPQSVPAAPLPPKEEEAVLDLEELVHDAASWQVDEPAKVAGAQEPLQEEEVIEEELEVIESLPEALSLPEAAQRLKEVKTREELSEVVLAFSLSFFKRAALFITRNSMALGWDGMGGSLSRKTVQGIMLPLNAPSIFKTVHDSRAFFLGAVPKNPINDRFLKLMGDEKPRSVFLIPVLFRGQVVNILYGDNGHEENAPFDISDLLILAPKVPQAFEDLIMRKKKDAQEIDKK